MTDHAHGQAADEFGFETEIHKVAGLDLFESDLRLDLFSFGGETDGGFAQAAANDFFEAVERAAHDEEDMFGIDGGGSFSAAHLHFEHRLDLASQIVLGSDRH